MPSSKPAGALTLASRTLNPRAALPARSSHRPCGRCLHRCFSVSPPCRSCSFSFISEAWPCGLRPGVVWCGRRTLDVEGSLPLSMAQCGHARQGTTLQPRGCVVPLFVGVSEWLNSFVVYLIRRKPRPRSSGLGRVRSDQEVSVPAACTVGLGCMQHVRHCGTLLPPSPRADRDP